MIICNMKSLSYITGFVATNDLLAGVIFQLDMKETEEGPGLGQARCRRDTV